MRVLEPLAVSNNGDLPKVQETNESNRPNSLPLVRCPATLQSICSVRRALQMTIVSQYAISRN
jgi:hypothetical protein